MFHKIKRMIELIKEFTRETRAAIEAYKELQELWRAAGDDGGMTAAEEQTALDQLTGIVEQQEQLGKE